jgi:hypothetical protein
VHNAELHNSYALPNIGAGISQSLCYRLQAGRQEVSEFVSRKSKNFSFPASPPDQCNGPISLFSNSNCELLPRS